jgi:hypothetical protein
MAPKRNSSLISNETQCSDDSDDYNSSEDESGSLDDFIASDNSDNSDTEYDIDSILRDSDVETVPTTILAKNKSVKSPPTKMPKVTKSTTLTAAQKRKAATKAASEFKPPGDSSYPTHDFSLTITRTGTDVGIDSLDSVAIFIETNCLKGGVSTEVGQRVFQLHLQGVFRMHWPATPIFTLRLKKILKALLPRNGKGHKIMVKHFKAAQTFSAMIGYITKDQGILLF